MKRVSDLFEVNPREVGSSELPISLITMADIDGSTATARPRLIERLAEVGSANRVVRPGDVVFARISPSMENGKVAVVPSLPAPTAIASGELIAFRPKAGVDPRILWAYLRWDLLRRELAERMTGSAGQQRLSPDVVASLELPVADVDVGTQLKALEHLDRAAMLRREANLALDRLVAAAAYELAARAPRRSLGDLGVGITYGSSERSAESGSTPILRIPNIVEGWIDRADLRYLEHEPTRDKAKLVPGDLLMVRTNGSIDRLGRAAVYQGEPDGAVCASYLLRLRCPDEFDPDFLWAWLRTGEARNALRSIARSTSGQYNLNATNLQKLKVPWAPESQRRVGQIARCLRRAAAFGRAQSEMLARGTQALLGTTFGVRPEIEPGALRAIVRPGSLPEEVHASASRFQLDVWEAARAHSNAFEVRDVAPGGTAADAEQALRVLEQLGFLIRESSAGVELWRTPQLDGDYTN